GAVWGWPGAGSCCSVCRRDSRQRGSGGPRTVDADLHGPLVLDQLDLAFSGEPTEAHVEELVGQLGFLSHPGDRRLAILLEPPPDLPCRFPDLVLHVGSSHSNDTAVEARALRSAWPRGREARRSRRWPAVGRALGPGVPGFPARRPGLRGPPGSWYADGRRIRPRDRVRSRPSPRWSGATRRSRDW